MRVGIVAVHGVIPQVRFGFQDEVATALCQALNKQNNGRNWSMTVVLPRNRSAAVSDIPTISRVHVTGDSADAPAQDFFDVHEAFWSPLDKGKTTLAKVLVWLVTTIFLPFNDFARYRERFLKACWDILYTSLAIVLGVAALLFAALVAAEAMRDVLCMTPAAARPAQLASVTCPTTISSQVLWPVLHTSGWKDALGLLLAMISFILSPLTLLKTFGQPVLVGLACGFVGAYLFWQVVRAVGFIVFNFIQFTKRDGIQLISRIGWTLAMGGLAFALLRITWLTPAADGHPLGTVGILLVMAVGLFNFGRSFLGWFVTSFFGDVQIYTTRDQNSEFFALRELILEKVVSTILNVVSNAPAGAPYERVHILAHSLGSTISMDAILRLYDMQAASTGLPNPPLPAQDWKRIRSFVTFGTSLEKTKYFFSAWNATPSQEWEQWNAAVYGAIFSQEKSALDAPDNSRGIFWLNNWFFSDFVSDEICTYRSFLLPGERVSQNPRAMRQAAIDAGAGTPVIGRLVAANREQFGPFPRYIQTHTHYVGSEWFWHPQSSQDTGVVDVLTWRTPPALPPHAKGVAGAPPSLPPLPSRYQTVSPLGAKLHKAWEVVR